MCIEFVASALPYLVGLTLTLSVLSVRVLVAGRELIVSYGLNVGFDSQVVFLCFGSSICARHPGQTLDDSPLYPYLEMEAGIGRKHGKEYAYARVY